MTVAKTNSPSFDKRWRYRVPPPRRFMSFCQCLSIINTDVCCVLWNSKHLKCLKIPRQEYCGLTRCHGNSILDINIPFTVSHRPCFGIILMKFETNWVKVRCWIQSILKMTHFLLPVGGAITLTHNCHIDAIGFIHRTNHWSVIKIRQCMWTLLDTSCISILAITSSPRHGQTVWDIKNPSAI